MSNIFIRINGRGNAWPVQLGLDHPFYEKTYADTANVSYSIIKTSGSFDKNSIEWEVIVDAGHGAVQYLITHENRIPEAVILTHGHHDHTFCLDWIVQSFYRQNNMAKKYPVYATEKTYDFVIQSYPHLINLIEFKQLKAGVKLTIEETDLDVTPIPVYHGESALGACMLVIEHLKNKAIISGDLLCPLIRKKEHSLIRYVKYFFADTNNRYPFPKSNHWSLLKESAEDASEKYLEDWLKGIKLSHFIAPNLPLRYDEQTHTYFDEFLKEQCREQNLFFSIFEFIDEFKPENVVMVHYSGAEDVKYHKEEQMIDFSLAHWAEKEAKKRQLKSAFSAPKVGDKFLFSEG